MSPVELMEVDMSTLALFGILSLAPCEPSGAAIDWEDSDLGQTAIVRMKSAPFPHASRANGFKNGDKLFPRDPHYLDNRVVLFIPKGYRPEKRTDLLIYLHGHFNNIHRAMFESRLREQVVASGRNVILVFPEGPKEAPDSGGGRLEEKDGLRHLVEEALDVVAAEKKIRGKALGRVALAGHSGAYRGIAFCLEKGGLEDHVGPVCLLDASYGLQDNFVDWLASRPDARLFSVFTAHLADKNAYLMMHLRKRDVPYVLLDEEEATEAKLAVTRVVFVRTQKLNHNQTVQWLERWLRASPLPPRPGVVSSHPAE